MVKGIKSQNEEVGVPPGIPVDVKGKDISKPLSGSQTKPSGSLTPIRFNAEMCQSLVLSILQDHAVTTHSRVQLVGVNDVLCLHVQNLVGHDKYKI